MSDGFPSDSCADVILSHGDAAGDEDRSLPVSPISGRDRKTREVLTQLTRESGLLSPMRKVELWMVVPEPDEKRVGKIR
jgi:hypothetical protein